MRTQYIFSVVAILMQMLFGILCPHLISYTHAILLQSSFYGSGDAIVVIHGERSPSYL